MLCPKGANLAVTTAANEISLVLFTLRTAMLTYFSDSVYDARERWCFAALFTISYVVSFFSVCYSITLLTLRCTCCNFMLCSIYIVHCH